MNDCSGCGHWFVGTKGRYDLQVAQCTVWPEWKVTSCNHFCGQYLRMSHSGNAPGVENSADLHRNDLWKRANHEQGRAIKAEKALKAARAEIRTLKTKA